MQLYKKRDHWWCHGTDWRGKRWWKSTRIKIEDDPAGRLAKRVAKKIAVDRLLRPEDPEAFTLRQALDMLAAHKIRTKRSEATMEILRTKGRHLFRHLGPNVNLNTFSLADAERYMDLRTAEGVGLHTVEKEFRELRGACRLGHKHKLYTGDATQWWPDALRNVYTPRDRWLTLEEFRRLRMAAFIGRRDHLDAYVYTGATYSELYRIRAEHVVGDRVFIDGTKTKHRKRWVPIHASIALMMARLVATSDGGQLFRPWLSQNMGKSLGRWCVKAGIERVSANDLRRTFASWMASAGVPSLHVSRLMGHAKESAMVARVYAQLSDQSTRDAIDAMPGILSEKKRKAE
jgi:integrase